MSLPPSVTVLHQAERTLYLVGTAHVSQQSVEDVRRVVEEVDPDVICVELCDQRYEALTRDDRWKHLDLFQVIRQGRVLFLLANLAIGAWQRKIGAELGVQPGAELLEAARLAEERGAALYLIDRDVQVTLRRTWGNLRFRDKLSMIGAIGASLFEKQEVSAEDIERLKEEGQLEDMLTQFSSAFPRVKEPLIDERDRYMASWLSGLGGERVVAVVGAAHVPGMVRALESTEPPTPREPLEVLPPRGQWGRIIAWMIPLLVLAGFAYGISREEPRSPEELLLAWALPNMFFAGLFTAIAGGRLSSITAATLGSPLTSLNPLINTGMVTGLVDAWARKPTVEDVSRIPEDAQTFAGFRRNPCTRVLLVSLASMFGSALGAYAGVFLVFRLALG